MSEANTAIELCASSKTIILSHTQALQLLEKAKSALARVHRIDEVKEARDKYQSLLTYLTQKRDASHDSLRLAEEIVARCDFKIGELLRSVAERSGKKGALEFAARHGIKDSHARSWLNAAEVLGGNLEGAVQRVRDKNVKRTLSSIVMESTALEHDTLPEIITPLSIGDDPPVRIGYSTVGYANVQDFHAASTALGQPRVTEYKGDEWYTPPYILGLVHKTFGVISLDPCSSDVAQQTVRAEQYFTQADDGLSHPWFGKVWLAPPYSRGVISRFINKLCLSYQSGNVKEALVLVSAYTSSVWYQQLVQQCSFLCLLNRRLVFHKGATDWAEPPMDQNIFYFGAEVDRTIAIWGGEGVLVYRRPTRSE